MYYFNIYSIMISEEKFGNPLVRICLVCEDLSLSDRLNEVFAGDFNWVFFSPKVLKIPDELFHFYVIPPFLQIKLKSKFPEFVPHICYGGEFDGNLCYQTTPDCLDYLYYPFLFHELEFRIKKNINEQVLLLVPGVWLVGHLLFSLSKEKISLSSNELLLLRLLNRGNGKFIDRNLLQSYLAKKGQSVKSRFLDQLLFELRKKILLFNERVATHYKLDIVSNKSGGLALHFDPLERAFIHEEERPSELEEEELAPSFYGY